MQKITILLVLAITLFMASTVMAQMPTGKNYTEIEVSHPGAGLAADFAVKERAARSKQNLKLGSIAKAEIEGGKGSKMMNTLFRLCLNVESAGKPSSVLAVVSVDAYSNHKLVSWKAARCPEPVGPYEQVPVDHAGIMLAANFAIDSHSASMKVKHTLDSIIKGEIRGKFASTYRICMKVAEEGHTQTIRTVVSMDQYSNMKVVSWEHSDCGKD